MERVAFLIEGTGERLDCLLNPETVVFRREAGVQRRTLMGEVMGNSAWSDDALIVAGGGLMELQLDLLFDTSLLPAQTPVDDVQTLTAPFWGLADHVANAQGFYEPHLVRFVWGKTWNLLGLVTTVSERFEMFLPSGAPQRSWLRMTFVRVVDPNAQIVEKPSVDTVPLGAIFPELPDEADTSDGEGDAAGRGGAERPHAAETPQETRPGPQGRLDQLAYELTGDPSNWRAIADFSGIDDPTAATAGSELRVPPDLISVPAR